MRKAVWFSWINPTKKRCDRKNGYAIQVFGSAFCVSDVEEVLNNSYRIGEHAHDGSSQESNYDKKKQETSEVTAYRS